MPDLKKIVIIGLVSLNTLSADVVSLVPYLGAIKYDNSLTKSLKDSGSFIGVQASVNDNEYLLETAYSYKNISYKDSLNIQNLKQHDLSLMITSKCSAYSLKIGAHYINSNEVNSFKDLGTGYIGIAGLEGSNLFDKDKLTYGVEAYYSVYPDAHNETTTAATQFIDIVQFSPYLGYSMVLSSRLRNDAVFKVNAIASTQYKDPGYLSYDFKDTVVYGNLYAILKVFGGEMKSGVKEGGFDVYNTKDLYTGSYEIKAGYYLAPTLAVDFSYAVNYYQEYNAATLKLSPEGYNSVGVVMLSYGY